MPHYNWRRSRPNSGGGSSSESPPILKPLRSSGSSSENSSSDNNRRSPSPPSSVDYSHLRLQPVSIIKPPRTKSRSNNPKLTSDDPNFCCSTCDLTFDEMIEGRQPRLLPCLHSFCTQCLQKVQDYLEALHSSKSRPSSRYSWRRHQSPSRSCSSSPSMSSVKIVLGHFLCPLCHNMTPISNGGSEAIVNAFPLDQLKVARPKLRQTTSLTAARTTNKSLLDVVVQEIHPKIQVIQKAVYDTELAKQSIHENVLQIEGRLMPPVASESEAVSRVRTELFDRLHACKQRRLNAIIRRQLSLKQCEKDLRFLFDILQKLNENADLTDSISHQVFPCLAKRLSDVGNALDKASICESGEDDYSVDALEAEIVSCSGSPDKAFAELTKPLYEKVVCNIPFLVMDEKTQKLATKADLLKISGGLVFNRQDRDETVAGTFKEANDFLGTVHMEVVPPCSGLAEIDLRFSHDNGATPIQVRPSTAFIRPLSLDSGNNKRLSSGSNKLNTISL